MVDKGFLISDEIEKLGLKLFILLFASSQMSAGDVFLTRKIARHHIHAKHFKIVDNRVELSLFPCISQIWFCYCFQTDFYAILNSGQEVNTYLVRKIASE